MQARRPRGRDHRVAPGSHDAAKPDELRPRARHGNRLHCNLLAEGLRSGGFSPVVLEGGLGKRARAALLEEIERTPLSEPLVVVATGQYLGEGFDCPQLDTLFLAFPVSFKGRLVQYTGRILRANEDKTSACVYDYADVRVPVLRAMHTRRLATYKQLGFTENDQTAASPQLAVPILAA